MPIEKIPGAAPPDRIGLSEKEGRNGKELTQADIRQVSRAMTEEYIDQLRTLAYEDAETQFYRESDRIYLTAYEKAAGGSSAQEQDTAAGFDMREK